MTQRPDLDALWDQAEAALHGAREKWEALATAAASGARHIEIDPWGERISAHPAPGTQRIVNEEDLEHRAPIDIPADQYPRVMHPGLLIAVPVKVRDVSDELHQLLGLFETFAGRIPDAPPPTAPSLPAADAGPQE